MKLLVLILASTLSAQAACNRWFIDFESGSANGTTVTAALLTNSTRGDGLSWTAVNSPAGGVTFATAGQHNITGNVVDLCGDENLTTAGALGLSASADSGTARYWRAGYPTPAKSASLGFWFYTDLDPNANVNIDIMDFFCVSNASFMNFDLISQPSRDDFRLAMENFGDQTPSISGVTNGFWWWISGIVEHSSGSNVIQIYNASSNIIGTIYSKYTSAIYYDASKVGVHSIAAMTDSGKFCYYDGLIIDATASPQWPLPPGSGPPPAPAITRSFGGQLQIAGRVQF